MFIGIDGSSSYILGTMPDAEYAAVYRNSYVSQLYAMCGHANKRYLPGPNLASSFERDLLTVRNEVIAYIRTVTERSDTDRTLVMAGFSRGAAVCIAVAMEIQRVRETARWARAIHIPCLILFDAVDRDIHGDTSIIPGNVERAFHAMRDSSTGSRWEYGNTGTEADELVAFRLKRFMSSHAGMGGIIQYSDELAEAASGGSAFWEYMFSDGHRLSREEDLAGSARVRRWMWDNVSSYVRIAPSEVTASAAGTVPRRLSALFTRLLEIVDELNTRSRERERERSRERGRARTEMSASGAGATTSTRADMEQLTAMVLTGITTAINDLEAFTVGELDALAGLDLDDWVDVIATANAYQNAHTAVSWSYDTMVRSGFDAAVSGTVGRLGEVIMRRLCRRLGMSAARNRAREINPDLVSAVRYVDRMYTRHPGEAFELRDLTDGAYIAVHNGMLYILGIAEVKSGRNFDALTGPSGQLARNITRIRAGGVVTRMSHARLSETFAADQIVFSPETTDWYLGVPDDEMMADSDVDHLLRELDISSYRLISLTLNTADLRTIAGIINDNLPEE